MTKRASPTAATWLIPGTAPSAFRKITEEMQAPSAVASSAGPRPPYHAATKTPKNKVTKGSRSPIQGLRKNRNPAVAATARTATA
jgi:hypothetical protein